MSATKEMFTEMREIEAFELSATKKNIIEKSSEFSKNILENGEITKEEAFARSIRNATFWQNTADNLKQSFDTKNQFFGIELTPINGRKMYQFEEDEVWVQLNNDLKDREELLKLAQNQDVIDAYGNDVPKISIKYAKDSLNVKF